MENDRLIISENIELVKNLLAKGAELSFSPKGRSMLPTIHDSGDSVILKNAHIVKKYDIVLYERDNGQLVMHRVVGLNKEETYNLCGDNQWHVEYGVKRKQIFALVIKINRRGRIIDCGGILYGAYVRAWVGCMPLRHLIFGGIKFLKKMLDKGRK